MSALAGSAAASTLPDNDLSYLRLLIGAELLAIDFQTQGPPAASCPEPRRLCSSRCSLTNTRTIRGSRL